MAKSSMDLIDFFGFSDEDLVNLDVAWRDTLARLGSISEKSMLHWQAALREMESRKLVELVDGSFDDLTRASIRRCYGPS